MCELSKGRKEPCKNSVGGLKNIYLFPYVKYSHYQINVIEGVELISFPQTTIYKFELRSSENTFSQSININESGVSYTQSLSTVLKSIDSFTNKELFKAHSIELRVIVETKGGKFFILGLRNGVNMDFEISTGGSKNSLNGYRLSFEANEEYYAPFIENLTDAGFDIDGDTETFFYLLQNGDSLIAQNSDNLITQNG